VILVFSFVVLVLISVVVFFIKPPTAEAICFRVVRACVRPSVIHVVVLCFRDSSSIC